MLLKSVSSLQLMKSGMSCSMAQYCKAFASCWWSKWFLLEKRNAFCSDFSECSDSQILFIWFHVCDVFTLTDNDVSCLCTYSIVAEGKSLNWDVGASDRSGRESASHGHHWQRHWHSAAEKGGTEEAEEEVPPARPPLSGPLLRLRPVHHAGRPQHHPGGSLRLHLVCAFCQSPDHPGSCPPAGGLFLFRSLLRVQPSAPSAQLAQVKGGTPGQGPHGTGRAGRRCSVWNRDQRAHPAGHHSCAAQPHVLARVLPGVQPREGASPCGGARQTVHHDEWRYFCAQYCSLLSLCCRRWRGKAQPATWGGGHLAAHKLRKATALPV